MRDDRGQENPSTNIRLQNILLMESIREMILHSQAQGNDRLQKVSSEERKRIKMNCQSVLKQSAKMIIYCKEFMEEDKIGQN